MAFPKSKKKHDDYPSLQVMVLREMRRDEEDEDEEDDDEDEDKPKKRKRAKIPKKAETY